MIALVTALIFPLAMVFALSTIGVMLTTHGGKMVAALRMEHVPGATRDVSPRARPISIEIWFQSA